MSITEYGRTLPVGRLVRELEGTSEVIECEGANPCPLRSACRLRKVLRDAQEAFFRELDPFTMTDLTGSQTADVLLSLSSRSAS